MCIRDSLYTTQLKDSIQVDGHASKMYLPLSLKEHTLLSSNKHKRNLRESYGFKERSVQVLFAINQDMFANSLMDAVETKSKSRNERTRRYVKSRNISHREFALTLSSLNLPSKESLITQDAGAKEGAKFHRKALRYTLANSRAHKQKLHSHAPSCPPQQTKLCLLIRSFPIHNKMSGKARILKNASTQADVRASQRQRVYINIRGISSLSISASAYDYYKITH
eukprot:TRINITY_DN11701_c0_g3_i2.p1 TRINITY_DN11701_c0_g3~~TRINITY_DN11701_c0_g3_i2.p1  ORF type:complete len:224 (-),score=15.40 TRINITY_DN11701_c0_g3_i2:90-761(-)